MSNNTPTNIERLSDLIDLDVESGETVEIETPNPTDTEVDVEFAADGSAEVNYFPDEETMAETPFDANLAEFVDEGELGALSSQLMGDFEEDHALVGAQKMDAFLNKFCTPLLKQISRWRWTIS